MSLLMMIIICLPLLSVNAATPNPAPSYPYPSGSSGCGTTPLPNCTYYYAETHFDGRVYWAPVFSDINKLTIGTVEGTYTFSTGNYDTWDLERVQVWNGAYITGTKVYDNTAHAGENRRYSNSSFWESYVPSVAVNSNSNFTLLSFRLKLYTATGSPNQTLYPMRYVQNITR